ncbi:hypothetical protein GQ53DRAFT_673049 [Thozetella sp. PMI_491]|nr:hypothetical protein GQ53DRAFT_673049 [Thozetella sp. PMI_491]
MPHAVSIASPGLQALILCGPGVSFPTFTSNPDQNPKALLPIANRPMVWYPIEFCYRSGITNITLICPPSSAEAITTALNTNPFLTSLPHPRPDLLAPKDLDQNTGTAEILRLPEVQSLVTSDFVVLPCDLVCELGGDKLVQAWMVKAASLSELLGDQRPAQKGHSGGLGVWYQTKTATPIKGQETDFLATVPLPSTTVQPPKGSLLNNLSRVVCSMPTDALNDLTETKHGFPIRHGLIRNHPRVRMLTTHRDAHIYIFPRWVMQLIAGNERLEAIGEDVVGWWAKAGWQKGLSEKVGFDSIFEHSDSQEDKGSTHGEESDSPRKPKPEELRVESAGGGKTVTASEVNAHIRNNDILPEPEQGFAPPFLAYVHSALPEEPLIRRVDTAKLLLQTSLLLAKIPSIEETGSEKASPFAHARKVAYPEGVKPRTTITKLDSLIAENVTVEEKTSIKESIIGANCQIHEGAKLAQCLLMEGVVVGKNCKLTGCVLGKRSEIGEGSTLTNCEVQENLLVEPRTDGKDEKLMSSSGLEATEEEIQDVLDQDDDTEAD